MRADGVARAVPQCVLDARACAGSVLVHAQRAALQASGVLVHHEPVLQRVRCPPHTVLYPFNLRNLHAGPDKFRRRWPSHDTGSV